MISFEVIITPEFLRSVERDIGGVMEDVLTDVKAEMIREFNEPKSGREYRGRRRASAPGEAPARQTGMLQDSISEPRVGKEGGSLVGTLVIAAPYAEDLEFGNPRIRPRPFVVPAIEEILRRLR